MDAAALERLAARMADRMESRGPDDAGTWASEAAGVAMGVRRLAVMDLSPAGRQPMVSASGRSVIAYNGEVYNFAEIRRELEASGLRFRGASDTEAVLEACEAWGVERAVARMNGMFAFAFWDNAARRLTLVRDRIGIKPLYWGRSGGVLFFGSQPRSFFDHPAWRPEVDRDALTAYMRHSYVPPPRSIFKGVEKMEPGCLVEIGPDGAETRRRYWDLRAVARDGRRNPLACGDAEAVEALDALLTDAARLRMTADVPVGVFLSGGVDSSTVAALMQARSGRPVKSFAIGFEEDGFDEAAHARRVAERLGTEHAELYCSPALARDALPAVAESLDEPLADGSQIPTYLVSKLARESVTVALTGDGGDEMFGGYTRYYDKSVRAARRLRGLPGLVRAPLAAALSAAPTSVLRARRLAALLRKEGQDAYYRWLLHWPEPEKIVIGGREPDGVYWDPTLRRDIPGFTERMQFVESATDLPELLLAKVDRASMAVGLEARVPLLDHRVVEFAWRLPPAMKMRNGRQRWLLRQVLDKYVPPRLTNRPKAGFGAPVGRWLRGALRDWADDLLAEDRLKRGGFFDPAPIRKAWAEHCAGVEGREYQLRTALAFEAWREQWGIGGG